jgi:alkylated DNA nucleotide flippase Atl1
MVLAAVAEICRRVGWVFRIVLADEIFLNSHHLINSERFSMRRFARVEKRHTDVLENYALKHGQDTTYGELAAVLHPAAPAVGEAIIQALTVRRRVEIDLTKRILTNSHVRIL